MLNKLCKKIEPHDLVVTGVAYWDSAQLGWGRDVAMIRWYRDGCFCRKLLMCHLLAMYLGGRKTAQVYMCWYSSILVRVMIRNCNDQKLSYSVTKPVVGEARPVWIPMIIIVVCFWFTKVDRLHIETSRFMNNSTRYSTTRQSFYGTLCITVAAIIIVSSCH